jgi:hypothetical protein
VVFAVHAINLGNRWRGVENFVPLYPRERSSVPVEIGGWIGPTASLDILEKRKISFPYQDLNPGLINPYPSRYTNYTTLAPTAKTI